VGGSASTLDHRDRGRQGWHAVLCSDHSREISWRVASARAPFLISLICYSLSVSSFCAFYRLFIYVFIFCILCAFVGIFSERTYLFPLVPHLPHTLEPSFFFFFSNVDDRFGFKYFNEAHRHARASSTGFPLSRIYRLLSIAIYCRCVARCYAAFGRK